LCRLLSKGSSATEATEQPS